MRATKKKRQNLKRRSRRVRGQVVGTAERPRLAVFRSLGHTYAQIVDDSTGKTLASASTRQQAVSTLTPKTGNVAAAKVVGKAIADIALAQGIKQVCFDRGGRKYHGRVKAVAEAAREAGLKV